MIEDQTKKLAATVSKLYRRSAERNIKKIIAKSHSADLAAMLEFLDADERVSIFQMVPHAETKAEILSHLSPSLQEEISVVLNPNEVQEILGEMSSDDAADLLGNLPEDLSKQIMKGMPTEDVQEVEELMGYPEDSAGAIMTSEVLALSEGISVGEAIRILQESPEDLITFYIYVVNDSHQLVGVLSLKQLILHRPNILLKDIMESDVIAVEVTTEQEQVAKIVEKYDFLALPVIDNAKQLQGVITVDDVIDVIREEASDELMSRGMAGSSDAENFWEHLSARAPWFIVCMLGGILCFYVLYGGLSRQEVRVPWEVVCLMPMAMFLVTILSNQTATLALDYFRSGQTKNQGILAILKQELSLAFVLGALLSLLSTGMLYLLSEVNVMLYWFPLLFLLIVLMAVVVSFLVPMMSQRISGEALVASVPVSVILANVLSILTLSIISYM
ncbi:MAG: magnesium transporter [Bdellovibrionaceae bacterium]|nr:magnesium transporter [Pseudobdellovibrionaceae bacterium]